MAIVIDANQIYAALTVVVSVGSTAGIMAARYGRRISPLLKTLSQFHADWYGMPERPGFDARPGLAQRTQTTERATAELAAHMATMTSTLEAIQRELVANGGGSLRDQLRRVEQAQRVMAQAVGAPAPLPLPAAELAALAVASEQQRQHSAAA